MKFTVTILLLFISSILVCCASNPESFTKMSKKERNEYMISLSKDLIKTFGPGYLRDYKKPIISKAKTYSKNDDMRPEIQQNVGRKYYTITFLYDPTKETLEYNFSAEVGIWKDSGQPMKVIFGNGYGVNFYFQSFEEMCLSPIEIVPYQQVQNNDSINIFE